jgi:hypothetical protein
MLSNQPSDPSRRMPTTDPALFAQPQSFLRSYRPLQSQPPFDSSRTQIRPGQPYPMYASPTIQPSPNTAMGSFVPSSRQYTTGQQIVGTQPASPYMMSPADATRAMGPYAGGYSYSSAQEQMGMLSGHPQYSNPIFPRSPLPPPQPEASAGMMGPGSLQLPPIRAAAEWGSIDPALAQPGPSHEVSRHEQGSRPGTSRQPDPKRPRMDIQRFLEPKND